MVFIFTYLNYVIASVVIFALILFHFCMRIAWAWRKRKWLAIDFFGIGSSYLIILVISIFWFMTENTIFLFALALFSILFNAALSYAVLRMLYPLEKRPANWFLLVYLSVPIVYLFKPDIIFVSLQITILSSLVTFVSFLLLATMCSKLLKIYAVSGMLGGLVNVPYLFVLMNKIPVFTFTSDVLLYLIVTISLTYAFYGLMKVSLKNPDHFVCDYDHRKDK